MDSLATMIAGSGREKVRSALETEMAFLKAFGALLGAAFTWFLWAMGNRRTAPTASAPTAAPESERDYVYRVNANGIERGDW
jgi:hypothetical protein